MAGRAAPADLSVSSDRATEESAPRTRARRIAGPEDDPSEPRELDFGATDRPT